MIKFTVLVVIMLNGQLENFVIDSNVSREDCAYIISEGVEAVELADGTVIELTNDATYVCEAQ